MIRVVRIVKVERTGTSVNGNPKHRVELDTGESFNTQIDASVNYGINNPDMFDQDVEITTEWGVIVYARPVVNDKSEEV